MVEFHVLLVASPHGTRSRLAAAIESRGFRVSIAGTTTAGLFALNQQRPDVLIVDPFLGDARPEVWHGAINRYRAHRSLDVMVLAEERHRPLIPLLRTYGNLGVVRPQRRRLIVSRLSAVASPGIVGRRAA